MRDFQAHEKHTFLCNPTVTVTCHCFSGSSMSSGQFRIKVCLESCHARGEAWLRPGSLSRQARDRSPAPRAPRVCAHGRKRCPGRAAASGSPRLPWAVPGRALPGTESPAGLARTCPCCPRSSGRGLRPRGLRAPEVAGLLGTGHGPRPAARRAPASRTRAVPAPAGPGPAAPPVGLPPASRVPRDPYLAPGQGASGGGGRGRRPARLPRFRRSQELNIPPLRAAPMGKTSGQQHHLPPGAEPRAGQPPGHARPGAQRGGLGAGVTEAPAAPWDLDALAGKGTARKSISGLQGASVGPSADTLGDFEEESRPVALVGDFLRRSACDFIRTRQESIASVKSK